MSPVLSARLLSLLTAHTNSDASSDPLSKLTTREHEILENVAAGLSNKRIALELKLQEKTVKHHMTSILSKLNVSNRTEAAMLLRDSRDRPA